MQDGAPSHAAGEIKENLQKRRIIIISSLLILLT